MLDDLAIGLVGGLIGDRLFGGWCRRHPYLTMAICIPPLTAVAILAVVQLLRN
jgi:uncharacterized membrane protein YeaQ/YmgE (transglycosylase-associated protein family)